MHSYRSSDIKNQAQEKLAKGKEKVENISEQTTETMRELKDQADKMADHLIKRIKENPLTSIGVAALCGLTIGALLLR